MLLDGGASRPVPAAYMLEVARTPSAVAYKTYVAQELALEPGMEVADIGCGPATDLADMANAVSPGGSVLGIDIDDDMLAAARRRAPAEATIALLAADAHALPLATASLDRVRTDRALQHMPDPGRVLAEIRRVLRPGGRAVLAEPDWRTLVIDSEHSDVSTAFVDYTCREVVRNPTVGRQVGRLGDRFGLGVAHVAAFPTVFRDFSTADRVFGLSRNARAACRAGYVTESDAEAWLGDLREGPLLAAVTLFVTTLVAPVAPAPAR